jgi:hypothetical protein
VNAITTAFGGAGDPNVIATADLGGSSVALTSKVPGDTGNNVTLSRAAGARPRSRPALSSRSFPPRARPSRIRLLRPIRIRTLLIRSRVCRFISMEFRRPCCMSRRNR